MAVQQTHDSVMITDLNGVIEYVNRAFEKTTGYTLAEVVGRNPRFMKSDKHDRAFYEQMWKVLVCGYQWRGRFNNLKKSGNILIEDATISPIKTDSGDITGFVAVRRDVTKLIELERMSLQNMKLESIGQLAAGIAHEINTPAQFVGDNLAFIKESFSEIIDVLSCLTKSEAKLKEYIDTIPEIEMLFECIKKADLEYIMPELPEAIDQSLDGVERISTIVKAMKEFSHPGSSSKATSNLNDAIQATITVARNRWRYVADMDMALGDGLENVPCHLNNFNQVVLNLVVNAADAINEKLESLSERGEEKGLITVVTRVEGTYAVIEIGDNANGMPEEIRNRIFDPFFTTKEVGKGTGQGLSIAHSIITEKHGGELTCDSILNEGTTFTIRLPLADGSSK